MLPAVMGAVAVDIHLLCTGGREALLEIEKGDKDDDDDDEDDADDKYDDDDDDVCIFGIAGGWLQCSFKSLRLI